MAQLYVLMSLGHQPNFAWAESEVDSEIEEYNSQKDWLDCLE